MSISLVAKSSAQTCGITDSHITTGNDLDAIMLPTTEAIARAIWNIELVLPRYPWYSSTLPDLLRIS
jgi:hypothetical protein